MKLRILIVGMVLLARGALSQECTSQWVTFFDTNPLHPKYLTGDTSTGYAVFNVWGDGDVVFELSGNFPHSRFMSFETESTRLAISVDHLFDGEITPDEGSVNPFTPGTPIDAPNRAYHVYAMQNPPDGARNVIELPQGRLSQAIMYRVYSPNEGVTLSRSDLPRVFAYDRATGRPTACPGSASFDPAFHFPEFLAGIYTTFTRFEFKVAGDATIAGLNKASGYMYGLTPLGRDEVVKIRFKAPTFFDSRPGVGAFSLEPDVRYWSFCTNDLPKNRTLNCLPDFAAKADPDGNVTVVVGTGDGVRQAAESRGENFLPDTRATLQRTMGFVYRNLVAREAFQNTSMYRGDYAPRGTVCSRSEYLSDRCGW